jgi:hypothetical protein
MISRNRRGAPPGRPWGILGAIVSLALLLPGIFPQHGGAY